MTSNSLSVIENYHRHRIIYLSTYLCAVQSVMPIICSNLIEPENTIYECALCYQYYNDISLTSDGKWCFCFCILNHAQHHTDSFTSAVGVLQAQYMCHFALCYWYFSLVSNNVNICIQYINPKQ